MAFEFRPYQTDAIKGLYNHFLQTVDRNPIVVMPTGTGKSVVIAEFIRSALEHWSDTRVLMVTHVKELIEQNHAALKRNWPAAPAGIYSAGLGQKDIGAQVMCAGIQSIYQKAYEVRHCDLLLIDECHLIPRRSTAMYGTFINELKQLNPALKVVGFTATPFRLDSGSLIEGDDRMFHDIAYELPVLDCIEDGYLSEVISKATDTTLDVTGVGTAGGDFILKQLEAAVNVDEKTQGAVDEIVAKGRDRGSWLIFCAGVSHAEAVRDIVRERGVTAEMITGATPAVERSRIIDDFRRGNIQCVTNMNVLTTGFDAPGVDLIGMLRPTKSPGLFVQMVGRGMRIANGKEDCLLLDFAGNCMRHGPVDRVKAKKPGEPAEGDAPFKTCPDCYTYVHAAVRVCPDCGHEWPAPIPKIDRRAAEDAVLSSQLDARPVWIDRVTYSRHQKRGKPDSVKVEYWGGEFERYSEWVCFEHKGFARKKAEQWWDKRWNAMGAPRAPRTVTEALEYLTQGYTYGEPTRIWVRPNGKYFDIAKVDFDVARDTKTDKAVDSDRSSKSGNLAFLAA